MRGLARRLLLTVSIIWASSLVAACSGPSPEQQILTNFFRAAKARDNSTLASISAVSLDPRTDGTIESFSITNIGPEERRPMRIKELTAEEETARKEDADFARRKRAYQDANIDAIKRVVAAEAAKTPIKGKDAEIQAAWAKWREDQSASLKKVAGAKDKLSRERSMAVTSLTPPGRDDVDVTGLDVEEVGKTVTADATLKSPSGEESNKKLVITLRKAVAKRGEELLDGHWIITSMEGAE